MESWDEYITGLKDDLRSINVINPDNILIEKLLKLNNEY
jgi:hypothetical protein